MDLEEIIKNVITQKVNDGAIEKLVSDQFEKSVNRVLDHVFGPYGDATEIIEREVKSVMIPYLEKYDYSKYIIKLDDVLIDVLNNVTFENRKMLGNFQKLMASEDKRVITVSELFDAWANYVSNNIDTLNLDIDYDDDVSYECVEITSNVVYEDGPSWTSFEYAKLIFECEKDKTVNFEIRLSHWKNDKNNEWDICYNNFCDISSLRYLNDFEILLMRLDQNNIKIKIDTNYKDCEIEVAAESEPSWS